MLARNKTQKILVSLEKETLLRRAIGDLAVAQNRSFSAIIENLLLESLFPRDRESRWIAENYLYGDDGGTRQALVAVFEYTAGGLDGRARSDNLEPLVQFARQREFIHGVVLTGDEADLLLLRKNMQQLLDHLKEEYEEKHEGQIIEYLRLKSNIEWGEELLTELTNEPQNHRLLNVYQLILYVWARVKGLSLTYSILSDLVRLGTWKDDPADRLELLDLLRGI